MSNSIDPMVAESAYRLCEAGRSPRCLTVAILIRYQEWDQLSLLKVDPHHYRDRTSYFVDVVATEFLRKFEPLPTTVNREEAAVLNALAAESQCYRTNERLNPYIFSISGIPNDGTEQGVLSFVRKVRKKIKTVLGPIPHYLNGRHGPGATFADRGRLTTVPDKMSSAPTMTRDCDIMLYHWRETAWGRACQSRNQPPVTTRGNRFTTVPKDSRKDRGIAIEPSLNVFYQLAVGKHIKGRLKRFGLDLRRGQDVHRQVACQASRDDSLCTIDLSNASDTVAYNLVKLLLPDDWFDLLSSLRCENTFGLNGKKAWTRLEKFSSMGNGFTFELETLIFGSLTSIACDEVMPGYGEWGFDVFTYGDDILCPSDSFSAVKAVLEFFGMSLNDKKSFHKGPFRESCGGDFWEGADVRPHNLESDPNEPHKIISLLNGVRRICDKSWLPSHLRDRYLRCWFSILDSLPENIRRCRGPKDLGDIVIHDDDTRWKTKTKYSIRYLRVWKPVRTKTLSWRNWGPDVVLAAALYGVRDTLRGPIGHRKSLGVTPRDAVSGYGLGWVAYS